MKFAQRERERENIFKSDNIPSWHNEEEKKSEKEKECVREKRKGAKGTCRCTPEGAERLIAKKEQSQFIPRAFVNLPREHITASWSF